MFYNHMSVTQTLLTHFLNFGGMVISSSS